jgi:UPF0716 protein FxsA
MNVAFPVRLAFVVAVVAEIAVIALLASLIGGWWTFLLILATALLGGWVIRKEGLRAWTAIRDAVQAQQTQPPELGSSQAAMAGGFLLVLPGFITDVLGLLLVLPATQNWARRSFGRALRARRPRPGGPTVRGDVVEGEVVDPEAPNDERNVIEGDVIDPDDPRR